MTETKSATGSIIFYCKDCEQIVDAMRVGGKYVYKCKLCGTKNVAFGTAKSITNFFHLKDHLKEKEVKVEAKTAEEAK